MTATAHSSSRPGRFHAAVWRWHFLIGMLVIPFLFMLAGSGALMLLGKPLDNALNKELLVVEAGGNPLPTSVLLGRVREAFPHATVKLYLPPQRPDQAARFSLQSGHGGGHGGGDGHGGGAEHGDGHGKAEEHKSETHSEPASHDAGTH